MCLDGGIPSDLDLGPGVVDLSCGLEGGCLGEGVAGFPGPVRRCETGGGGSGLKPLL